MRSVAVGVLVALLWLFPVGAHAQVYKEIKGCTGSIKLVIACIVIERGAEKVLNVGLDELVAYIFGEKSGIVPAKIEPSPAEAEAVRTSLVPWAEFKAFLLSAVGKEPADDPAQLRLKIGNACAAKDSPICAQFGFFNPSPSRSCSGLTQDACAANMFACSWNGSACRPNGGIKELFRQ
jgi:hypothetical protein